MPSGGKREGAGRPPKLSYLNRIRVGAECEAISKVAREKKLTEQIAELISTPNPTYCQPAPCQRLVVDEKEPHAAPSELRTGGAVRTSDSGMAISAV